MNPERYRARVVFDTNILISALLSPRGAPFQCLALARTGVIFSVSCSEILDEFREKLVEKFYYSLEDAEQAVHEVASFSELVTLKGRIFPELGDPDDCMVLECALVGNCDYLISGDRHLLALANYDRVRILSAREFLSAFAFQ